MEFNLKIKSNFHNLIKINNLVKVLNDDEVLYKINLNLNESFFIDVFPQTNKEDLNILNHRIEVLNINNKIKFNSNLINVFECGNDYIIELINNEYAKNFKILSNFNNILVYNSLNTNINYKNLNINLDEIYSEVEIKNLQNLKIMLFKNDVHNYMLILKNNDILFSDHYSTYKIEKNQISILSNISDIAKHGKITNINLGNFKIENYFVYTHSKPSTVKNEKLVPVAFLEAVKIKNENLAKYYLEDNLKKVANINNLSDFFKDFKKTTFSFYDNHVISTLFYKEKKNHFEGKKFDFLIQNNKIAKITQI